MRSRHITLTWRYIIVKALKSLTSGVIMPIYSGVTRVGDTQGGNSGCHPSIFSWKKTGDLFLVITVSAVIRCHPCLFSPEKLTTFLLITVTFIDFTRASSPPGGCHHASFLPVRPRNTIILCKFAHKIFSLRVSPPGGCHPGRSADATAYTLIPKSVLNMIICTPGVLKHRWLHSGEEGREGW